MRLNKYLAAGTTLSRRSADIAISEGRVLVNGELPSVGQDVNEGDKITLDGRPVTPVFGITTILLNKPTGYVVSRDGQGSKTVYNLLPDTLHHLNPVGRLDKYSSGLLVMTNDGALAERLTHPRNNKQKLYEVTLNNPLSAKHQQLLREGVPLSDGPSKFDRLVRKSDTEFIVSIHEGRNRQIRRTFDMLGYFVTRLHRTQFGPYRLNSLAPGRYQEIIND